MKLFALSILKFFDFFHQKKILKFLKKKKQNFDIMFDVGAHHGETIKIYTKNFDIGTLYSFEASKENFINLKNKIRKLNLKNVKIILENYALGSQKKELFIKQMVESSSSTINELNFESNYFIKKKRILLGNKKDDNLFKKLSINQVRIKDYMDSKDISKINFLKIDTEGYEFEVLIGASDYLNKINTIIFEHHYHDMIKKNYNFADINALLIKNNFKQVFKAKMYFRKTFEYIYENQNFKK